MSRIISRAEGWERAYQAFSDINFSAFDFNTVKQSLIDYVKLHFPETFNDYIESSEFIAIIETFAYVAELLAYRVDMNAHENFMTTAQRRDSILRLAKLVSYNASRPLPARGLVKITSVSTTENVLDANGTDLANRVVRWNDPSNPNWKEQFLLIMNRVLEQDFGTVGPFERFQIQDVLFELYNINNTPLPTGVFSYSAVVNGSSIPMELVPAAHDTKYGIVERRPENNSRFTLLYGSDGLGDSSETTGFFCFTKQGTLQRFSTEFDGITPNQVFNVEADNVNETDVWVNGVDPITRVIRDDPPVSSFRKQTVKSGEWIPVDLAHSQNIIFNTNPNRNKYEVDTQDNSRIRLIFGDGEFADIPSGTFDIWVRTSVDEDILVPQSTVVGVPASFTYIDSLGRTQTFTFTFTLVGSLQNASASEDTEHIRRVAPAVYYSQDRMVNGEDYNTFMLQDPSILKLRSVNRTFAGDSKYIPWHDPSQSYENVKLFSDDGILYFQDRDVGELTPSIDASTLISGFVEPLLSSTDVLMRLISEGEVVENIRRVFTTSEKTEISTAMSPAPAQVDMYYDIQSSSWRAVKRVVSGGVTVPPDFLDDVGTNFIQTPIISIDQPSALVSSFNVHRYAKRLVVESPSTAFWNTNDSNTVIDYSTLNTLQDQLVILKANTNYNRTGVLQQNWHFQILGQELVETGPDVGLSDIHRISVLPADENDDNVPDNLDIDEWETPGGIADILKPKIHLTAQTNGTVPLPVMYVGGRGDVVVKRESDDSVVSIAAETPGVIYDSVTITGLSGAEEVIIYVKEYVYFTRLSIADPWVPVATTYETINSYVEDYTDTMGDESVALWKRHEGRNELNFAWFHRSSRYFLIDPAPSNIIDTFIIPKGYYIALKRWLEDPLATKPSHPTPLDLRNSYGYLLDNKMISDTVILHPGTIKLLFGSKASAELRARFKIVRTNNSVMTDNQIKTVVVTTIRNFFDISTWEFGESFYFTELAAAIHLALPTEISSVVLVPSFGTHQFGDLFQVFAREDEILYPDISVNDVEIVSGFTSTNLRFNG